MFECMYVHSNVCQYFMVLRGGQMYLEYLSAFYVIREIGHPAGPQVWLAIGVYPVCYIVRNLDGVTSCIAWEGTAQTLCGKVVCMYVCECECVCV